MKIMVTWFLELKRKARMSVVSSESEMAAGAIIRHQYIPNSR